MTNALFTLERITAEAIDSVRSYESAANTANTPHLVGVLRDQAAKRNDLVADLNAEIVRLGGEAQTSGSTAGTAQRLWQSVAEVFARGEETAAERVEEAEDHLEEAFRKALDAGVFEPHTRAVVARAHARISEGEKLTDRLEDRYD